MKYVCMSNRIPHSLCAEMPQELRLKEALVRVTFSKSKSDSQMETQPKEASLSTKLYAHTELVCMLYLQCNESKLCYLVLCSVF